MDYTTKKLKQDLRNGPYAWPGGYPIYFIADDGEALSYDAVKENFRIILNSTRNKINDGWRIVGCDINWENPDLYCAHTGNRVESAYAEEDAV